MINEPWYNSFLATLSGRYPKKSQLARELMSLLSLEHEALYRRLRKDVKFTFQEIVKIAANWNISLDEIIGIHSEKIPFMMQPMDYLDPSKQEIYFLQHIIQSIKSLKHSPEVEFMDICNKLPRSLYAGFARLNQFYLFKWLYQYGNKENIVPFSEIMISEKKRQLTAEYYQTIKNVPSANFIFDRMIFEYLIRDIQYFHSTLLITSEEKELIKQDLYNLLDYLSEVASRGYYPETKNKVNIYLSQLNVSTNYSYVYTNETKICFVHVFDKFEIYTFDKEMVSNFREWMQLKKRTSSQISEVDERSRIEFFVKQRQLIDNL